MKKIKQQILANNRPRADNFSKCEVTSFMVESIEVKSNLNAFIGSSEGLTYIYKMKDEDDAPNLFSYIKVWYVKGQKKKDTILRHTIRKWELYTDPSIVVDETGEPLAGTFEEDDD